MHPIRRAFLRATLLALLALTAQAQAQAQAQSYSAYQRQSAAIERNANAGTNQALRDIQAAINRDNASGQALLQRYVRQNFPRLRQQYYASGASRSMPFMQFANRELMSHATQPANDNAFAAGQAAHQAQLDRFSAMQQAHRAQTEAGDTMIRSNQARSNANIATIDRSTEGSIRGNSVYTNPATGRSQYMPTYAPGMRQAADGTRYYQDQNGHYFQQQGSSWVAVDPASR